MKRDPALNVLATQAEKSLKVEKLSELPAFSRVLTDGSAGALLKLPAAVEKHVCAIETGVKRAIILYDAEKLAQIRPFISHLRGKLIA
jgi:general secretion pathway protein E